MRRFCALLAIFGLAAGAQANAGTPLMWGSMLYLLLGNYLIAVFETFVLRRLYRGEIRRVRWQVVHPEAESLLRHAADQRGYAIYTAPWLIVANYASAFAALYLLDAAAPLREAILGPKPIERVALFLGVLWCFSFLLSLAIELPFFTLTTKLKPFSRLNLSLLLKVHLASYLLITGWFWFISSRSLFFEASVVPASQISGVAPGWVYYLDRSGSVRRVRTNGSKDEFVTKSNLPGALNNWAALSAEPNASGRARLVAALDWHDHEPIEIFADIGAKSQVSEPYKLGDGSYLRQTFGYQAGRTFLNPDSTPYFRTGFWAYEGVWTYTPERSFKLALEMPGLQWMCRSATTLPSGHGVVQFGPQVVLIDAKSREVSFLAMGQGPTVLLDP